MEDIYGSMAVPRATESWFIIEKKENEERYKKSIYLLNASLIYVFER